MTKPIKNSYAIVYASILPQLREIAMEHGYALAVHGSMASDFDLIACPWTEEASDPETLVHAFCDYCLLLFDGPTVAPNPAIRPHGRMCWGLHFDHSLQLPHGGPYIDLSIMPRIESPSS